MMELEVRNDIKVIQNQQTNKQIQNTLKGNKKLKGFENRNKGTR